jgi:hypothetical protein
MSHCTHIEDLIIHRQIAPLSEKDERTLSEHLSSCAACLSFESKIANISFLDQMEDIKPRRDMKHNLMRQMRSRVQQQRRTVVDRIIDIFAYRPAFYKVAAAAMLLLVFLLASPRFKQPQRISTTEYRVTALDSVSLNVINLNQIIQIVDSQKVGINLSEDTLLTKILYTL